MSMRRGKRYGNGWGSRRRGVWMDRPDRMESTERMDFPPTTPVRIIPIILCAIRELYRIYGLNGFLQWSEAGVWTCQSGSPSCLLSRIHLYCRSVGQQLRRKVFRIINCEWNPEGKRKFRNPGDVHGLQSPISARWLGSASSL